ncbi:hypothetical protein GCM10022227_24730 [Streptomyces sedi]
MTAHKRKIDATKCLTGRHIPLDYLSKTQGHDYSVTLRKIFRDCWWGTSLWPLALVFTAIAYSWKVSVGLLGIALAMFLLAACYRSWRGHRPRCAILGGVAIILGFEWI